MYDIIRTEMIAAANCQSTVNPEIFAIILLSRIALKDILASGKFRDYGLIYLCQ